MYNLQQLCSRVGSWPQAGKGLQGTNALAYLCLVIIAVKNKKVLQPTNGYQKKKTDSHF